MNISETNLNNDTTRLEEVQNKNVQPVSATTEKGKQVTAPQSSGWGKKAGMAAAGVGLAGVVGSAAYAAGAGANPFAEEGTEAVDAVVGKHFAAGFDEPEHFDPANVPLATSVTDDMDFDKAFASARGEVGAGGVFEWQGNQYSTFYKEEWDELSNEYKDRFGNHHYGLPHGDALASSDDDLQDASLSDLGLGEYQIPEEVGESAVVVGEPIADVDADAIADEPILADDESLLADEILPITDEELVAEVVSEDDVVALVDDGGVDSVVEVVDGEEVSLINDVVDTGDESVDLLVDDCLDDTADLGSDFSDNDFDPNANVDLFI